jgi:flagellar operon protein (TIGR03826 family)
MEMVNCPKCGKVFAKMSDPICESCLKKEEVMFDKVVDFLKEFPDSSLHEVATATDVSVKKIMRYIKEGRIEITAGMKGELRCAYCGKPIRTGRFCDKCIVGITSEVKEMFTKKPGMTMHTYKEKK